MPSDNSFKSWILGIIGAVITAVLIFVIEQKLTQPATPTSAQKTTPARPPKPQDVIIHVAGQVLDSANRVLENVHITVQVSSFDKSQSTDSLGRYNLSVENVNPELSGSIKVEAAGYKTLTYNETLQQMSNRESVVLEALGSTAPRGVNATAGGVVARVPVAKYVIRPDFARLVVAHQ